MNTPSSPDKDAWRPVGEWRVAGDRLYIGDSWAIADGLAIPATPGTYDIEARIFWYGADERVASLRGWLHGAMPDGERDAGEFAVDVASAGVIDAAALDRWITADRDAYETWQERFREGQGELVGFFPCEEIGGPMVFTSTGFGDGTYRVSTLLQGDRPVGFEAHFLEEGQRYLDDAPRVGAGAGAGPGAGSGPRRVSPLKAWAIAMLMVPVALVVLVVGVTLGLFGWVMLKVAKVLSRFRK